MASHPILIKVLCVALVASIMLPVGRMIFPFVDTVVSGLEVRHDPGGLGAQRSVSDCTRTFFRISASDEVFSGAVSRGVSYRGARSALIHPEEARKRVLEG